MSAATLERPAVKLATPRKGKTFLSYRKDLRLVVKPDRQRKDLEGNIAETIQGQHLAFDEGKLLVPAKGPMKGEKGETLDSTEILTFLLGDEDNNVMPHHLLDDRQEGFWLLDEPAPAPSVEERDLLSQLGMDLDVDGLEAFVREEENGFAREALLEEANRSLARAKEMVAERDEALARARAEGEAAAKPAPAPKPEK